jgi:hypothetical protein
VALVEVVSLSNLKFGAKMPGANLIEGERHMDDKARQQVRETVAERFGHNRTMLTLLWTAMLTADGRI